MEDRIHSHYHTLKLTVILQVFNYFAVVNAGIAKTGLADWLYDTDNAKTGEKLKEDFPRLFNKKQWNYGLDYEWLN